MKRKPKPATAGEKIVMRWGYTLAMCRHDGFYKMRAADVDRAIASAVRKERERCVWCARNFGAMDGAISAMKEGRLHP